MLMKTCAHVHTHTHTHTHTKSNTDTPSQDVAHLEMVTMKVCAQKSPLYVISVYCHLDILLQIAVSSQCSIRDWTVYIVLIVILYISTYVPTNNNI
jgi:hypothetical protein